VAPGGVQAAVINLLQLLYAVGCADPYPPKSGVPLALLVTMARQVSVSLAGSMAVEAAAGPAVEGMVDREDVGPDFLWLPFNGLGQAFAEGFFHFPDALFDRSVVLRIVGRAVERYDPVFGQDAVDGGVVEWAAVVALEEERRPVLSEKFFQMQSNRFTLGLDGHEGFVAVLGAEVLDRVDVEPLAFLVLAPFRAIDRPGEVRLLPGHVLTDLAAFADLAAAHLGDHVSDGAARDALLVAGLEGADALAPLGAVAQGLDLQPDLFQGQGPRLLWPRRGERGFAPAHPFSPAQQGPVTEPESVTHLAVTGLRLVL